MKLYLTPGACSLADHIALREAKIDIDLVKVDLQTRRTEDGRDYMAVNGKGYVPALELDNGEVLTENAAILCWVAERMRALAPSGEMGRVRLVEMLSFISAELHKPFVRCFFPANDAEKTAASEVIDGRLNYLAGQMSGDYLFGNAYSVADAYLYVMLRWAQHLQLPVPDKLTAFFKRVDARPAVQQALKSEEVA